MRSWSQRPRISIASSSELPRVEYSVQDAVTDDMPIVGITDGDFGRTATWLLGAGPSLTRALVDDGEVPARADFASRLHDLKNALEAAQTLASRGSPTHELVASIQAEVDRARRLCAALLAKSLPSAPRPEPVDLGQLLQDYADALAHRLPPWCSLAIAAPAACVVPSSAELILSALDNLTKNAIEAMTQPGQLRLTLGLEADFACIEVLDSGRGLSDRELADVNSGGGLRSTRVGGSELGLLSVHRAMSALHGKLRAEHAPSGRAGDRNGSSPAEES
jgi:signal transduction histidine kinase